MDDGRWCAEATRGMGAVHVFDHESGNLCRCGEVRGFSSRMERCEELLAEALYPPPTQGWEQWRRDVLAATPSGSSAHIEDVKP